MTPERSPEMIPPPAATTASGEAAPDPAPGHRPQEPEHGSARAVLRAVSFRNISAIYLLLVLFVVFALWVPDTFLQGATFKSLLTDNAEVAMLAIGLVLPLAAGVVDLAIGSELGLGAIVVAWLLVTHGVPIVPAIVLTIIAGCLVGLINGWLVVRVKIDSFIATIAMQFVLLAVIDWVSNSEQIINLSPAFQSIAATQVFGIGLPVYLMLVLGLIVWYVLDRTPLGRRVYATGGNIEAARLAGVRVNWVVIGSLVACAGIAAISGLLVSANLGTGDPTIGPSYLLPAYSAAFLGSTQFRNGRVNVWGTVIATYVLALGVKGLQLAGGPVWIPNMFDGVALLVAVGMAKYEAGSARTRAIRRILRFDRPDTPASVEGAAGD